MCSGECLIIRSDKQRWNIPLRRLEKIVFLHSVDLPSRLVSTCQAMGISLFYINSHQLNRSFAIVSPSSLSAIRQQAQLRLLNHTTRVEWSRLLVQHKLKNLQVKLSQLTGKRPQHRRVLTKSLDTVSACQQGLPRAQALDSLRGLEGSAQKAWFSALAHLVPGSLGFSERNRRPPKDPVNAMLSLSYTLLYLQAWEATLSHGLNSAIGFFHEPADRQSLACDLMEPLRIEVDLFVMGLFNSKQLQARDFYHTENACMLRPAARKRFQQLYEKQSKSWLRLLNRYALLMVKGLDRWTEQQAGCL